MLTSNTASALEVTWSAVALLGTAVSLALLVHIWLSYRAVSAWINEGRAVRWGPRHKFVLGFLIGIGLLLLVWVGFVALGANALVNPPPVDAERQAASDRAGWILVILESVLFGFQGILLWAWVSLARPSLHPSGVEPNTPAMLLFRAIDLGREMGHLIANDLTRPVSVLDEIARDERTPAELRADAALAIADLEAVMQRVKAIHEAIKAQEDQP
jgi:hypothetical protein